MIPVSLLPKTTVAWISGRVAEMPAAFLPAVYHIPPVWAFPIFSPSPSKQERKIFPTDHSFLIFLFLSMYPFLHCFDTLSSSCSSFLLTLLIGKHSCKQSLQKLASPKYILTYTSIRFVARSIIDASLCSTASLSRLMDRKIQMDRWMSGWMDKLKFPKKCIYT